MTRVGIPDTALGGRAAGTVRSIRVRFRRDGINEIDGS
jgi:hypothetical protein